MSLLRHQVAFAAASRQKLLALIFAPLVLAACGGGDPEPDPAEASAAQATQTGRARAQAIKPDPSDKSAAGSFTTPFDMGVIAIHMALQPDGRVMYYGTQPDGSQTAYYTYGVWDPAAGTSAESVMLLPNDSGTDLFCSSQTVLPLDGRTFIAGGDTKDIPANTPQNNSNLYDNKTGIVQRGLNMNRARWYSSVTTLMNGEVYIQGGYGGGDRPEVRQADGKFRLLSDANTSAYDAGFPKNWLAPDGRVFGFDGSGKMYYVDPADTGEVSPQNLLPAANGGHFVPAAMFRPGLVLKLSAPATAAAVIDFTRGEPVLRQTEAASAVRVNGTAVVLPDGQVLVLGGGVNGNILDDASYTADTWNPVTGQWTIGARYKNARLYHGTSLLLPDGRVLLAGGGAPGPLVNKNGEIYSPPYLFDQRGQLATRPVIASAPTVLEPGQVFRVTTASPGVSRVTMVRMGSVSHTWNNDQRLVDLPFSPDAAGTALSVVLPSRATDTPPGFYLLFVFDAKGVPSVAKIMRVNLPGKAEAAQPPMMEDIADQTWANGTVRLQPNARSPRGATLRYTASGLPPGLAVDAASGTVTGMPTTVGSYYVTLAADDGRWSGVRSFRWDITPDPIGLAPLVVASPLSVGNDLVMKASASGSGVTYSWDFGDGTKPTLWSNSPSTTHRYTKAGYFAVTVTARDASGKLAQTQTVMQRVHLPLTAKQAAGSSQLAWQPSTSGNPRLWVVNPDTDTASAIDAVTGLRVAEIPVGLHPTAIARGSDGRMWVVNHRSASLSVIDPVAMTVAHTIALPPASAPYGIAADPSGSAIYVTLEATGQLQRYDTTTLTATATVALGPNPRHLAVTGDGRTIYVSRFITPPLPGESTTKAVPAGRGGEVLKVTAATMKVERTLTLTHSDKPDAEKQGRGVPNYLGTPAISPDGTQAFVPSKQDNVMRGSTRDGRNLDFQNTVRAISSRLVLASDSEDLAARIDHDNSSVASAATFDASGVLLFVALETSREVAVLSAHSRQELLRLQTGIAPQALLVSPDGSTLYVHNLMNRSVFAFDLRPLLLEGHLSAPIRAKWSAISNEKLKPEVLKGKQLFYDAQDTRLARDRYMSCASCHADAKHDGRTWDFTGFGEGLRNTPSLRGRAGMAQGFAHWSANFDEIQDFEGQIRNFAGGTGLMSDANFNTGTRKQPLGDRKAGLSADLDALAAYLNSLTAFESSPWRSSGGMLSGAAQAGRTVFARDCASCHGGPGFTTSGNASTLKDIGTLKSSSGQRLGGPLSGIDVPTLRDVWATAPYLHDGSAATLAEAVQAHKTQTLSATDLGNVVAYLNAIGGDERMPAVNLSQGKVTTQSSTGIGAWASRAVDGRTDGNFWNGSVTHSLTETQQPPWWQVDLGQQSAVQSVQIWNRTDCCAERLANFYVFVATSDMSGRTLAELKADSSVAKVPVASLNGSASITLSMAARGRFVRVQLSSTTAPLSLAEVQVFGWSEANLARGKTASQSTTLAGLSADRAVDGNQIVFASTLFQASAWWQVDLGQQSTLQSVRLWKRADCCAEQLSNFVVFVSATDMRGRTLDQLKDDARVAKVSVASLNGAPDIEIPMSTVGRYVRVQLNGSNNLSLAEVQVMGTPYLTLPTNSIHCAEEGGTCMLPSGRTATVWYGAGSEWTARTGVTGSISCSNTAFGDPQFGFGKSCRYQ
jgi:DNA-binding beta-propeller fold protein YncE